MYHTGCTVDKDRFYSGNIFIMNVIEICISNSGSASHFKLILSRILCILEMYKYNRPTYANK